MTLKIHSGTKPSVIKIGDFEIPCAVLEDGSRVLSHRGLTRILGGRRGGARSKEAGAGLPVFIAADSLKSHISNELGLALSKPKVYENVAGGGVAYGVDAELLPAVCDVWLKARDQGDLLRHQLPVAQKADIIMRGLAHIGITALVDEATGFQDIRARKALEEILDKFIAEELRKWAKTFPDEFYKEMFRLRGWSYIPWSVRRPSAVGKYTNDLVYQRLAPGVLQQLKRRNPTDEKGRRKVRHHQWLTEDVGHPRLREHLAAVIALMKASTSWDQFRRALQRALPRYGSTMELPLED